MFGGKYEMHKSVPISIEIKNKFRENIKKENFKYNHYFDGWNEPIYPMYSYY